MMIRFKNFEIDNHGLIMKMADNPDGIMPIIPMSEMNPLDIGILADNSPMQDLGNTVMRLEDEDDFKVINLSRPEVNAYWPKDNWRKVRILPKGTKIILEVV